MKLIFCLECQDMFKMSTGTYKVCSCGRSMGKYLDDDIKVKVHGPCFVIGLSNNDLLNIIRFDRNRKNMKKSFEETKEIEDIFPLYETMRTEGKFWHIREPHERITRLKNRPKIKNP